MGGRASRGEAVDRTPLIKALGVDLDDELLTLALTHRSYAYENGGLPPNERLEFLGDAVLGLVVTDHLYRAHPDLPEGQLAKLRASVVNMQALAGVARSLGDGGLGAHLLLGVDQDNARRMSQLGAAGCGCIECGPRRAGGYFKSGDDVVDLIPITAEKLPAAGMPALDALRLVGEELVIDGSPMRNLATFVTTWMEPEAQRLIAENLHRNFIDHAEYPRTAELEQRCIRMLADLFHAPGETTGARTQGSSEAIMLGALSLKWKWRERREAAGKSTDRPNLVFGGDVHVVWEKFCRYFDVEPRIVPLKPDKYTIGAEDVDQRLPGRAQAPVRPRRAITRRRRERGLCVAVPVPALGVGFPAGAGALHQRLRPQVRAGVPGHWLAHLP